MKVCSEKNQFASIPTAMKLKCYEFQAAQFSFSRLYADKYIVYFSPQTDQTHPREV